MNKSANIGSNPILPFFASYLIQIIVIHKISLAQRYVHRVIPFAKAQLDMLKIDGFLCVSN